MDTNDSTEIENVDVIADNGNAPETIPADATLEDTLNLAMDRMEESTPSAKPSEPAIQPPEQTFGVAADAPVTDRPASDQPAGEPTQDAAPSSWKRDVAQKWAELPPEIKAEINRRESDFHKGVEQYKPYAELGHEYERVITPNMDLIRQSGATPAQAMEYLFNAHRTLTYGTPDQKQAAIARIARDCGVDLASVAPAPEIDAQTRELMRQNQALQQFQQNALAQQQNAAAREIEHFAQDTSHGHFEAVKQDMAAMLQSGMAENLQDAYEKAVWARADLRKSLVEQERTEAEQRATEQARRTKAKSAAVGVRGSGPTSTGAMPKNASLEDTIAAAIDGLI